MLAEIEQSIKAEIRFNKQGHATLSKRGFSRMTGVHQQNLVTSNMAALLIQKLNQYGFDPDKFNEEGIPDVALGLMVNYYAFQSKTSSLKLIQLSDFLTSVGARVALQKAGNWEPESLIQNDLSIQQMFQQILDNQVELDKWKAVAPHGLTGMSDITSAYAETGLEGIKSLSGSSVELFTVNEWYQKTVGGELDKSLKHSIANRLAAMFKQMKKSQPDKKKVYVADTPKYYMTSAYPKSDFPLLSCCLMQLIAEKTVIK